MCTRKRTGSALRHSASDTVERGHLTRGEGEIEYGQIFHVVLEGGRGGYEGETVLHQPAERNLHTPRVRVRMRLGIGLCYDCIWPVARRSVQQACPHLCAADVVSSGHSLDCRHVVHGWAPAVRVAEGTVGLHGDACALAISVCVCVCKEFCSDGDAVMVCCAFRQPVVSMQAWTHSIVALSRLPTHREIWLTAGVTADVVPSHRNRVPLKLDTPMALVDAGAHFWVRQ